MVKKLIFDSFNLNYISIMNIQNPFIIGNKLLLPTESESLEININNVFNHFKTLFVLVKKNDIPLIRSCFHKYINEETLTYLSENLLVWKTSLHLLKNKYNFDKTVIIEKSKLEKFNHLGLELTNYNLVLPIFTVAFKNIISYLENKNGDSNLDKIYNNILLSNYFKDDLDNIKNKFQLEQMIKSLDESNYWSMPYNCLSNLNQVFKSRKFNVSYLKKSEDSNDSADYLEMIFKNKRYVDAASILKKQGRKKLYIINNSCNYTKEDINKLFLLLDEKQRYFLFCNLLISKKYCHLVVNNEFILEMMKNKIEKFAPLFRYLFGYSWLRLYTEESIKKSNLKSTDDIIFDINTASKLPIFPFCSAHPKYNPYMPIMVADSQLKPEINMVSLREVKLNNNKTNIHNNGICNIDEFRKNMNIFTTRHSDNDLFAGLDWSKLKIAIGGSIMSACIQKKHPLVNIFNEEMQEEKMIRYFNEYYPKSDIDVMFLKQKPFEYMKNVIEFFNQICVNTCIINPTYAEPEHVNLNPLFQAHLIVQKDWIIKNLVNENITIDFIYKNLTDPNLIELFKPYFKIELENKIKKDIEEQQLSEDELKKNYPDYFLPIDKYDIKIHIYNNKDKSNTEQTTISSQLVLKINYKYRITSRHFDHPIELFMTKSDDFISLVSQFHLPCVRAYYDGTNVLMTPTCVTANLTYMNIDYKYVSSTTDIREIINKNRMRGFGIWLNDTEIESQIEYSSNTIFWSNLYGSIKDGINRGGLSSNHKLFHPRLINEDSFHDCPYIDFTVGYKQNHEEIQLQTINDIDHQIKMKFNIVNIPNLDMSKFTTIDKDGNILPVQKWIIEAYYEYNKMTNIF